MNYQYSEFDKKCIECPVMCESCLEEGICLTCYYGYKFDTEQNDCIECKVKNCMNCYESVDTCLQCIEGFYFSLKTKKCEPCHEDCLLCSGPKPRDCQKCSLIKNMQKFSYERDNLVMEKRKQQILKQYPEFQHQNMLLGSIFHYSFDKYCVDICHTIDDIRSNYSEKQNQDSYIQYINHVDKGYNECAEIRMNHPEDQFIDIGNVRADWDYASQQDHQAKLKKSREIQYGNQFGQIPEIQEKRDLFIDEFSDSE